MKHACTHIHSHTYKCAVDKISSFSMDEGNDMKQVMVRMIQLKKVCYVSICVFCMYICMYVCVYIMDSIGEGNDMKQVLLCMI